MSRRRLFADPQLHHPIRRRAFAVGVDRDEVGGLITALFGVLRVDLNSKVLLTLLAAESIIVFIYDGAFLFKPGAEGVSMAAFQPSNLFVGWGGLAAVLVIVVTAFIGFEAAPVFAEESRDARRTIPLATFAGLGFMLFIYVLTTWAVTVATGPSGVVAAAQADSQNLLFSLAGERLGAGLADVGSVLLITSAFAAMLSFHNTCARYSYALAREGVEHLDVGEARVGEAGKPREVGASNELGEFESGVTAAWLGPVGSVVLGGLGTLLVAGAWVRLFPALAQRDRLTSSR
jgi:hypothetical protein